MSERARYLTYQAMSWLERARAGSAQRKRAGLNSGAGSACALQPS